MSSITQPDEQTPETTFNQSAKFVRKGAIAGLAGGLAFGLIMAVTGMLPMVGMLIRQNNALVGFIVHMGISAIIGGGFGTIMAIHTVERPSRTLIIGVIYGFAWWILGALVLMPILLGASEMILVIDQLQIDSLFGHLVYGLILAVVINWLPD